jgi:hypothetical protein
LVLKLLRSGAAVAMPFFVGALFFLAGADDDDDDDDAGFLE